MPRRQSHLSPLRGDLIRCHPDSFRIPMSVIHEIARHICLPFSHCLSGVENRDTLFPAKAYNSFYGLIDIDLLRFSAA